MSNHIVNNSLLNNNLENDSPKIYVACLAAYNNNILHGAWIDASLDIEAIQTEIKQMLKQSPITNAEEYAIHCHEGFYDLSIGEYELIESVHEKASFIVEHGEVGAQLLSYYGSDLEVAKETLENHYQGEYDSELDFAIQFFDGNYLHNVPDNIQSYIDYEKFRRDVFIGDCFSLEVSGKTHVFWNC